MPNLRKSPQARSFPGYGADSIRLNPRRFDRFPVRARYQSNRLGSQGRLRCCWRKSHGPGET